MAITSRIPGADIAIKQLARQPTTNYSRGIRLAGMPQIRTIIEAAWEEAIASGAPAADVLADGAAPAAMP